MHVTSRSDATSRRIAAIAVNLTAFLVPFMSSAVNIGLPDIASEFGMGAVWLAWVATAYTLAIGVLMVPIGKLADIYGRKLVYVIGVGLYTVASLLCAVAPSGPLLVVVRFIQGSGSAMIFGTGLAILTSIYPAGQRGQVLGINTAVVYTGLTAGPFLGGVLVSNLGWRSIFWINVPLGLAALLFTLWKVKGEWAGSPGHSLDIRGSVIYGVAVVAAMVGFSSLPSIEGAALIAAGIVAGVLFVRNEARVAHPIVDLRLFRGHRAFTLSGVAALINYGATAAVSFLLSLYLRYCQGMSAQQAGVVLIAQPVMMAVFSPLAGRLSDRIEPRIVASSGMAITVLGLVLMSALGGDSGLGQVLVSLVVLGFGYAFFSSPNTSAIMGAVEPEFYGVASGMVGTMRTFGQMLSMGLVMILFTIYVGGAEITQESLPQFLVSMRMNFWIAAALCCVGVLASLARGSVHGTGAVSAVVAEE